MRWLIGHPGPHFSVHDLYVGWSEALRDLGEHVFTFNLGDRISFYDAALIEAGMSDEEGRPAVRKALDRKAALETAAHEILRPAFLCWPDVVLLVSAFWYPTYLLDALRGRGMTVVLLHTESPYQDDEQLERAAHADVNLINDPANLAAYEALEGQAAYMPHAYRPGVHHPPEPGARPQVGLRVRRDRVPVQGGIPRGHGPGRPRRPPGRARGSTSPKTRRCATGPPTPSTTASTTRTPPRRTGRPGPA